jgi:hypothetical protein
MLLLAFSTVATAVNMVAVPKEEAYCHGSDAYCYEWKFVEDPTLRFVATGYDDGGGFYFCRRGLKGDYSLLFAAYPAMEDSKYPGLKFWGYAWDIKDIVLSSKGKVLQLQVAFENRSDGEDRWIPPMQRFVPYVLFRGVATQPDIKVEEKLRFTRLPIEAIQRRAMANQTIEPTSCGGG